MAVGMHRALHSAMGLPNRSSSALWMLVFLIPAEVSNNFMSSLSSIKLIEEVSTDFTDYSDSSEDNL